jgi:CheY-like chemotaxis protein
MKSVREGDVRWPVKDKRSRKHGPTTAAKKEGRCRILLADDDESFRSVLSAALRREGYDVVEVGSGHDLQDSLTNSLHGRNGSSGLSIVISDLNMPDRDGFAVLEWLRQQNEAQPFILITSDEVLNLKEKAERLGANGLLDKAFEL